MCRRFSRVLTKTFGVERLVCVCLLCAGAWVAPGCGEEVGAPPVITALRTTSTCFINGFDDGSTAVTGRVSFEDPDGDVVNMRVSTQECGKGPWQAIDTVYRDLGGVTSGTLSYLTRISTLCIDEEACRREPPAPPVSCAVRVELADGDGNVSNVARAPYEVSCVYPCP